MSTREILKNEIDYLPEDMIVTIWNLVHSGNFKNNQKLQPQQPTKTAEDIEREELIKQLIQNLDEMDIPTYDFNVDKYGRIIIDENSPPDLIDWAVNG
jgi:hypothetical protein